jgi:aconitate hydratase
MSLVVCAVLSGNRNFEARINPDVKANYLASPPLCVAYALTGRMDVDILTEPLGEGSDGEPVYLRDLWPSSEEIKQTVASAIRSACSPGTTRRVHGRSALELARSRGRPLRVDRLDLRPKAALLRGHGPRAAAARAIRALACPVLGDSVTTDHISPAGAIKRDSPAGRWLIDLGTEVRDFNSYGSPRQPRGDDPRHVRQRAAAQPAGRAGEASLATDGEQTTIYEAAMRYATKGCRWWCWPAEYGSARRDWAAKGTALLGVLR